jgi:D-alanine--poly(phosphoribitol) ligase subunit 1
MFTSGTTGKPKGVAVTHQNLLHFIAWGEKTYQVTSNDNFANLSPLYFDNSVFDFYVGLFNGASLTPVQGELLTKPLDLIKFIERMECSIWFSVPSLLIYLSTMKVFGRANLNSLRIITFGGEGFPKSELKKIYDKYNDRIRFVNVYGPTECTCICSSYDISESDFENLNELPSIGKISQNFSYIILDDQNKRSHIGELCLMGPNVALGYYREPERGEGVFLDYSDENHYMNKMYKTGDLVEEVSGLLHFKGRKDNQIKHMGYRIELEEVEIALSGLESIDQAAVLYVRQKSSHGKIIAFVSSRLHIDPNKIKKGLLPLLPSYMIPNQLIILERLPKNANGKIDKVELKNYLKGK